MRNSVPSSSFGTVPCLRGTSVTERGRVTICQDGGATQYQPASLPSRGTHLYVTRVDPVSNLVELRLPAPHEVVKVLSKHTSQALVNMSQAVHTTTHRTIYAISYTKTTALVFCRTSAQHQLYLACKYIRVTLRLPLQHSCSHHVCCMLRCGSAPATLHGCQRMPAERTCTAVVQGSARRNTLHLCTPASASLSHHYRFFWDCARRVALHFLGVGQGFFGMVRVFEAFLLTRQRAKAGRQLGLERAVQHASMFAWCGRLSACTELVVLTGFQPRAAMTASLAGFGAAHIASGAGNSTHKQRRSAHAVAARERAPSAGDPVAVHRHVLALQALTACGAER